MPFELNSNNSAKYKITPKLPDAYFYDFGGQDYYHGLYKAFYSAKGQSILFWHQGTNENKLALDNDKRHNYYYNLEYWLGQHQYFLNKSMSIPEHFDKSYDFSKVLLVETRIDEFPKRQFQELGDFNKYIKQRFEISLKADNHEENNLLTLRYIKDFLHNTIKKREESEKVEAEIVLYKKIYELQASLKHEETEISTLLEYYDLAKDDNGILKGALSALNDAGMVLYYD